MTNTVRPSGCCCMKTMIRDWEQFKVVVEASRQPELMLIVDKWKQLQFVSREYLAQYALQTTSSCFGAI